MRKFKNFIIESNISHALKPEVKSAIKNAGGKIYQIGGAVRDEILGEISKDLDLLVVGIELNNLAKIISKFGRVDAVGKSFGILKFSPTHFEKNDEPIDISVPRVDEKSTGAGHKDFEVKLGKGITLQQDQLRRDFWMNAIAKDVETGEMHDIESKGQFDIENKQISVISPSAFEEDPLRMMRAMQFAARFGFNLEKDTEREIVRQARKITTVSADRFQEEFAKMFTKSSVPSKGIKLMIKTGLMKHIFRGLENIDYDVIDKLDKSAFPAFLAVLLKDYKWLAGQNAQKTMRVSNEIKKAIDGIIMFIYNPAILRNEFELVQYTSNNLSIIKHIDDYLKAKNQKTISMILADMKRKGKPTSFKELGVNGRDLAQAGLKGRSIGDALKVLLKFAVETGRNDKKSLMGEIGITEEIKVESVLKYKLKSKEINIIKQMQKMVLKRDLELKPLQDKDLHITLVSGPEWKRMKSEYKGATFSDVDFPIHFNKPKKIVDNDRISWYTTIRQQKELRDFVTDLIQVDPDPNRIFHVSIANKTGKPGDSVANIRKI
jgi:tRNA nucleotidyltransferase (CCA-adding enzyme)